MASVEIHNELGSSATRDGHLIIKDGLPISSSLQIVADEFNTDTAIQLSTLVLKAQSSEQCPLEVESTGSGGGISLMDNTTTDADSVGIGAFGDDLCFRSGGVAAGNMRLTAAGNLGIGNNSPTDKLEVVGNLSIFGNKLYNGSAANSAGISLSGSTVRLDGFNGIIFNSSTTTIGSQTERMRITNTGNVGIGTSSPSTKLTVVSSDAPNFDNDTHQGESIFVRGSNSSGDGNAQAVIAFGKADGSSSRSGSAIASVQTDADTDKVGLGFYTSPSSSSIQTMQQQMLIDHLGNVGIGTTSPTGKLDISSTDDVTYSSSTFPTDLVLSRANSSGNNQVVGINFICTGDAGVTTGNAAISAVQTGLLSSADLVFQNRDNGVRGETMRIASTGNVGIGTATTLSKFSIADGSLGRFEVNPVSDGVAIEILDSTRSNPLDFKVYGNDITFNTKVSGSYIEAMRIDSSQNVGIGTSSPTQKLDVNGYIRATSGFVGDSGLSLWGDNSSSAAGLFVDTTGNVAIGSTGLGGDTYAQLYIGDDNTIFGGSNDLNIAQNGYYQGGWKYVENGKASLIYQIAGTSRFYTAIDGTADASLSWVEQARIDADGLKFNGDTAAANALDDYEEGTFTPVVEGGTTAGTYTANSASGNYTKIGNVVTCWGSLIDVTQVSAGSGTMKITGLPFIVRDSDVYERQAQSLRVRQGLATRNNLFSSPIRNTDEFFMFYDNDAAGAGNVFTIAADFLNNMDIGFCITYQVN